MRGGGHNVAGKAISGGGRTIDLSLMREVTVHEDTLLVNAAGGCQLGDMDAATGPLGLIVPAGVGVSELFAAFVVRGIDSVKYECRSWSVIGGGPAILAAIRSNALCRRR